MGKLTPVSIKNAKPKEKPYTLSDGGGLQITIKSDGRKVWEFRYISPVTGERRKTTIKTFPEISLKDAREKARTFNELIHQGKDPIEDKKETKQKREIDTKGMFERVVHEWLEKQKEDLAKTTYTRKVGQFENDVIPFFKGRTIASITHPEIVKVLEMKAIKAPESANRLFTYLDNLFRYATMKGYAEFNIIANIHKKTILKPTKKKHYPKITDPEALKELVTKIYSYKGDYSTKNALKMVLHVPLRAENLIGLKWEYIDLENGTLTVPRHEMKVKDKNLPDFVLPLTRQAVEILNEQKLFSHGVYVFKTSGYADEPISKETPNRALERMGFNDEANGRKIRLHGFRGTFRSLADTHQEEHGISYEAKEKALDHIPQSMVERAYTHKADYSKELRKLFTWWSDYIDNLREVKQ
jgi:integrase